MIQIYETIVKKLKALSEFPSLFFRLVLSYGFYEPAMKKLSNIEGIAQWFASMNYPLPTINAYLATATETTGFILLFLGLGTRIISIPLMVVMVVAITTVHMGNGFAAGNNGFEIPFYYLLMLFYLGVNGAGKFSVDYLISKKLKQD